MSIKWIGTTGIIFVILGRAGLIQETASSIPTFEVASVKPHLKSAPRRPIKLTPQRVELIGFSLRSLVALAWSVRNYQFVGPLWLQTELYDVVASVPEVAHDPAETTAAPASRSAEIRVMLQRLIIERFQLKYRREIQQVPGYELVADASGPKLKPHSASEFDATGSAVVSRSGHFEAQTISDLAKGLTIFLAEPVIDKTGIGGRWDIKFDFSPDELAMAQRSSRTGETLAPAADEFATKSPLPSIFTAVRDLGLQLTARKVAIECFIVDYASRLPMEN